MTPVYGIATAALCGALAGATLVSVLHAQSATAPAFAVGVTEQITDEATLAKYRTEAAKTEAAFGGKVVARGAPQPLDSSAAPGRNMAIIEFPSMKALKSWWTSPAYTAVRPLREKSSVSHVYALEGVATP